MKESSYLYEAYPETTVSCSLEGYSWPGLDVGPNAVCDPMGRALALRTSPLPANG
jgi:hypothetical protein